MTEAERSAQLARHRALGHRICTAADPYQAGDEQAGQRVVHVDAVQLEDWSVRGDRWHCPHCGLTFAWPPMPRTQEIIVTDSHDAPGLRPVVADAQEHPTEAGSS